MVDPKDIVTLISLAFAGITLWIKVKGDTKSDGAQISEILVKMELMQSDLKEIKSDFKTEVRSLKTEFEDIKERLIKVEQSAKSAHKRIDSLHDEHQSEE